MSEVVGSLGILAFLTALPFVSLRVCHRFFHAPGAVPLRAFLKAAGFLLAAKLAAVVGVILSPLFIGGEPDTLVMAAAIPMCSPEVFVLFYAVAADLSGRVFLMMFALGAVASSSGVAGLFLWRRLSQLTAPAEKGGWLR